MLPTSQNMKVALPAHRAAFGCPAQGRYRPVSWCSLFPHVPFWQSAVSRFLDLESACTVCLADTQCGPEYPLPGQRPVQPHTNIQQTLFAKESTWRCVVGLTDGASATACALLLCESGWGMSPSFCTSARGGFPSGLWQDMYPAELPLLSCEETPRRELMD